ncbi:MFS transporter [Kribbella deserti]|uniref:MFS transporter n=1 Tax=Kribbella deserti TaxID=1926257 RepID=A0ABV6QR46_9ACTN
MPDPRRLLADIRPLREYPAYRRLWIGQSLSSLGSFMTGVAVAIQVYDLTGSSFAVGAVGLATVVPTVVLGLLGGSIVDAVDRRKLVLITSLGLMVVAIGLTVQAFLDLRQLWLLYVLAAVGAGFTAVDMPARRTITARLLPPERLAAAAALHQLNFQVTLILAPLLAGVLTAAAGPEAVYIADVVTFLAVLYGVWRLAPMPPHGGGTTVSFRAVADGLAYARRNRLIASIFLTDLFATGLAMPSALFPALAATHFHGGPETVGLLYSSIGIGGLVAAVLSGPLSQLRYQGRAMLVAVGIWGGSIAAVGFTSWLWLAVALLILAGASDIVTTVFRATILQVNTPDELRGRLNSLDFVIGAGGPRVGDARAGTVAGVTDPVVSIIAGGLACLTAVVVQAATTRTLTGYTADQG